MAPLMHQQSREPGVVSELPEAKARELRLAQRGGLTNAASVVGGWPCPRFHRRVGFGRPGRTAGHSALGSQSGDVAGAFPPRHQRGGATHQ
ncbi:hypothetical protein HPB50_013450 [Hyalomma asiaticum]|uniref:Uncharacterized protein n=1 Tax=Hyalomma asiaticum TaxID=266040 RepID=A0ACB7SMM8_HYAAI|nr:hypothetical protein HPB50_013450 [Hyalomma asiaticum]